MSGLRPGFRSRAQSNAWVREHGGPAYFFPRSVRVPAPLERRSVVRDVADRAGPSRTPGSRQVYRSNGSAPPQMDSQIRPWSECLRRRGRGLRPKTSRWRRPISTRRSSFPAAMTRCRLRLLQAEGRLVFLRVHDVGSGFGPPTDHLDAEVIVRLDSFRARRLDFSCAVTPTKRLGGECSMYCVSPSTKTSRPARVR